LPPSDPGALIDVLTEDIEGLFERLDPTSFVPEGAVNSRPGSQNPIRTYADERGLTLSAISDRQFMAWIVAALMPLTGCRVLEIGAGTGYLAYALAQLVGSKGSVKGCEIIPELFETSIRNPLIRSTSTIELHQGDFVDVVPSLGQFDVVIATSAMSSLHPALLNACHDCGGMIAFPVEIQGGGDCYTIFRRQGATLRTVAAKLSVSVPTTGSYTPDPAWFAPLGRVLPAFDLSKVIRVYSNSFLGHPVYDTLSLRSFLQAHEPLFASVSLGDDGDSFVQKVAFGLVDKQAESFCLQLFDHLVLGGPNAFALARRYTARAQEWEAQGRPSLADYRYRLELDRPSGISFEAAISDRAEEWRRV
jgi:protein-L-isoaspartate O-methyltransferase